VLARNLFENAEELMGILGIDEAIGPYPQALMNPHASILDCSLSVEVGICIEQSLEDVSNILEIELVVKLGSGRKEARRVKDACATDESVDGSIHYWFEKLLNRRRERQQVLFEDGRINSGNQ
jgi:hypothetical protein